MTTSSSAALRSWYDRALTVPVGPAEHHHLRAAVAARLEQHRVERDARRQPAGLRLHGLGPADLAAVGGDDRVVGHVLRLERRDLHPAPGEVPADPGDQRALARVGGRAGHQHRSSHGASIARGAPRASPPPNVGTCGFCSDPAGWRSSRWWWVSRWPATRCSPRGSSAGRPSATPSSRRSTRLPHRAGPAGRAVAPGAGVPAGDRVAPGHGVRPLPGRRGGAGPAAGVRRPAGVRGADPADHRRRPAAAGRPRLRDRARPGWSCPRTRRRRAGR